MSTMPLVSGIMIFFNAQRFMVEAIESVLDQSYTNWELILIDDGSSDDSTRIALYYAEKYPDKIRYFEHASHANRGMSASRNRGIQESKGELIAFLDADDKWVPHKLVEQVALLNRYPEASICYGPTLVWHSWAQEPEQTVDVETEDWYLVPGNYVDQLVEAPLLLIQLIDDEWTCPCTCSVLIRRSAFDEVGAFEEDFRGQLEDMVFHTKLLYEKKAYVSSQCWGLYRQHRDNHGKASMASGEWLPHQPNRARHKYLRWVEHFLFNKGSVNESLRAVLDREMKPYASPEWSKPS